MLLSEPSLPEKVLAIHQELRRLGAPHAFGGALALAYYAEPRATIDVDLNLFVAPSAYPDIERGLAKIGVGDGTSRRSWSATDNVVCTGGTPRSTCSSPMTTSTTPCEPLCGMSRSARAGSRSRARAPARMQGDLQPSQGLARHRADDDLGRGLDSRRSAHVARADRWS